MSTHNICFYGEKQKNGEIRKISQNYYQLLFLNKSSAALIKTIAIYGAMDDSSKLFHTVIQHG